MNTDMVREARSTATFLGAVVKVTGLAVDGERVGDVRCAARPLRLPDDVDRVRVPPLPCFSSFT
jgi:hypothetical protein